MNNPLTEAIEILKRLPEKSVEEALEALQEIKTKHEKDKKTKKPACPKCKEEQVVRNGHKCGKQAFLCRNCGVSFVETSQTVLFNSHFGESVWKQIIRDTVEGISIDKTAANLHLDHKTVFNMRHKILFSMEQEESKNPTKLNGVCEADETYVLESYKGKKLPDNFWRKPRKHGGVAEKRGLSNEYICVCTGVERDGNAIAVAVNRANAGKQDIDEVFGERVSDQTLLLSDGAKAYSVLDEKCKTHDIEKENGGFYNINTVNSYHSFIKERNRNARGFATKYINRYNSLFSKIFRKGESIADQIYDLLCDMNDRYQPAIKLKTKNLLMI